MRSRVAVVLSFVLLLGVGLPAGMPLPGGFPLSGLVWVLTPRLAWGAPVDPDTPEQSRGGATEGDHRASTADTRADGGAGRPRGQGAGELPPDTPLELPAPEQVTTPARGEFDPETSVRDERLSSELGNVFTNADGSLTQILSTVRVNYAAGDGRWLPIDTSLVERPDRDVASRPGGGAGDVRLESAANDIVVSFAGPGRSERTAGAQVGTDAVAEPVAQVGSWQELASVSLPGGEVFGYGLEGARPVLPTVRGSTAVYADVLPGVDVELEAGPAGLKETLVLDSPQAGSSWLFPLRLSGLTASLREDGSVALADARGDVVAWIPAGWMWDSHFDPESGEFTGSAGVRYELVEAERGLALRVSVDEAWLHDPARVWPVRVDPSLTAVTNEDVFINNYTGGPVRDGDNLPVGTAGECCGTDGTSVWKRRSFLRFGSIVARPGFQVASASLTLFHTWSYDCNTHRSVYVSNVAAPWTVAGLAALAPASYPGPALGAQVGELLITDNYPACTNTGGNRGTGYPRSTAIDVSLVNGWLDGSIPNYGLALTASESDKYAWKRFTSSNFNSGQHAPTLELTWAANYAPQVFQVFPAGEAVGSLTPELSASGYDPDNQPGVLWYRFHVAGSAVDANGSPVDIAMSDWSASPRWQVPAGVLSWGESYLWRAEVLDWEAVGASNWYPLPVRVPQPLVTGGLSQNGGLGVAAPIGNYTTSATDAQVATVGPELAVTRSYNSRDSRTTAAFGAGWSSLLDAQVRPAALGTSPALVTMRYPTGQEVTFGRNPDGSWDAGSGRFMILTGSSGGYELMDKSGVTYRFAEEIGTGTQVYGLTEIEDGSGRKLVLSYASDRVQTITSASGRALHFSWLIPSGSSAYRVASVSTDPASPGDPSGSVSTWTYSYSGNLLTSVCPPATPSQCHAYTYDAVQTLSLHQAAVLDAGPRTYLRGGSGPAVGNSAGESTHVMTGVPSAGVGTAAGPLPGSTAFTFNGSSTWVELVGEDTPLAAFEQTVSLWFKTTGTGVLFGAQNTAMGGAVPNAFIPTLYVGTDGKLHGKFYTGNDSAMASPGVVNNGQWHHVVLAATGSDQVLYLDGNQVASTTEDQTWHGTFLTHAYIGASKWTSRPAVSGTYGYFNGSIAEVSLYSRPLTAAQVAALYTTGATTTRPLTTVTRPTGGTSATVSYDVASGRVASLVDANGGSWSFAAPQYSGSHLTYAAAVLGTGPSDYWRLQQPNGEVAVNQINGQQLATPSVTWGVPGPYPGLASVTAAGFDGTASYATSAEAPVDTTVPYTVSALVKLDTQAADQAVLVLPGSIGQPTLTVTYDAASDRWLARVAVLQPDTSTGWVEAGSANGSAGDAWTHLTVTVDASNLTLYVDGTQAAQTASTLLGTNPATGMELGRLGTGSYLDGSLAEVATIRRALTAAEVTALQWAHGSSQGSRVKTVTTTGPSGTSSTVHDVLAGGRIISATDTLGYTTSFGYDTGGFLRSVTDPNGNMTVTGRDVRGNVVSHSTCQDQSANHCSTVYYTYWPVGGGRNILPDARNDVVLTVRDGRSDGPGDNEFLTTFSYDQDGNRTAVTDVLGRVTTTVFSTGVEPAVGGGTVPAGLPLAVTRPGGGVYTVEYYANGDAAATVDPSGARVEYLYDGLGRLVESTQITDTYLAGLATTYAYNKNGQLVTSTAPPVLNRVTGATHTAKTTIWYDADGQAIRTRVEDLTGGDALRETERGYNSLGQLQWVSDAVGRRTYFTYDTRGNRTSQTPTDGSGTPLAPTVEMTYDARGQLITTVVADHGGPDVDLLLESRDYDPAGRLARVVDAMGWELLYTYTDNNLPATTTRYDASTSQSYVIESKSYDPGGYTTATTSANNTLTTTYGIDPVGRTVSATLHPTGVNRTTTAVFDRDDNVVSTVVSDGTGASTRTDALFDLSGNLLAQTAYPDGLGVPVGRWRLDETTGTAAADGSGNSPATTTSGLTWTTDHGGSAAFDGTGPGLATAGPVLDTARSYTVTAWVNLSASASGDAVAVAQDGTVRSGISLGYTPGQGWVLSACPPDTSTGTCATLTAAASAGTWTHLAGVYDATTGQLRLYTNGVQQGQTSMPAGWTRATGPLRIGAGQAGTDPWTGGVDDVQVYQSALTGMQVDAVYQGTAPAATATVIRGSATYDQRGLPVTVTDPNGVSTYLDYDEVGRAAVSTTAPVLAEEYGATPVLAPAVAMTGYDTFGAVTETRDAKGRVTTTAYNANGQPISQTLPDYTPPGGTTITGAQSTVEYDALGREWKITDPLGHVTEYHYDSLSRMDWVQAPDNGQTFYEYSLAGQSTAVVDPTGARVEATYDYLGRPLTYTEIVRQPSTTANTTAYQYRPSGLLERVTPPGRNGTVYQYNAVGETTAVTDPAGNTYQYGYDFAGRPTTTTLPDGSGTRVLYDGAGRPTTGQTLDTNGTTVLATSGVGYDRAGNTLAATDPAGHITTFAYDPLGQLVQAVEPVSASESITTSYGYDIAGAPTRFTNGNSQAFWTTYNTWGLPESSIEPATTAHPALADRTTTTVYDQSGQPVTQILPGGVSISTTFDEMGRPTLVAGSGAEAATTSRSYTYDDAGRPLTLTGSGGANTLTWDDRGLLLSVAGPSGNSSYSYTDDGLLATRVDAAGTTSYGYDPASRLATITNPTTAVDIEVGYNTLSQVDDITYTDGTDQLHRWFSYDNQHRLVTDTIGQAPPSTVQLGSITYGYDANSNITSKNTEGFAYAAENTYTYDWTNRLTSWLEDNGTSTTLTGYGYDHAGNRTANGETTFTYDERNRLLADSNATTYTYTPRGTRTEEHRTGQPTLYTTTNAFGQVITQDGGGATATYTYDGLGRLLQPGHEYTGLGNDLASDGTTTYTRDPAGGLIGASTTTANRLVWTDQHTDVVGQYTPASTTLTGSAAYNPLGVILDTTGLIGTLGYQSEYTDTLTGRVNMHARWYNPDTGQFDNPDTIPQSPIPASINANRYGYANANPLSNTDPSGHVNLEFNPVGAPGGAIDPTMVIRPINQAEFEEEQRQQAVDDWRVEVALREAAGPCSTNRQRAFGQGNCVDQPTYSQSGPLGCPDFLSDRDSQKLMAGEIALTKTYENCTVLVLGTDGTAYYNGVGVTADQLVGVSPVILGEEIDSLVPQYGSYDADGSDRLAITLLALDDAYEAALTRTQEAELERQRRAQEDECQKDFWCRNAGTIGVVVGIVAAIGCGIVTAGAGLVGCLMVAGAIVSIGTAALEGNIHSLGDVLLYGVIGAATGAIDAVTGGVGGKIAGAMLRSGATALARAGAAAFGGALGGALAGAGTAAAVSLLTTGSINLSDVISGAILGAAFGAVAGAAFANLPMPRPRPASSRSPQRPGCGGNSFLAGTLVLMADGTAKPIEDIQIGDQVTATDPETGETAAKTVTALHLNHDTDLTELTISEPEGAALQLATETGEGDGERSSRGPTDTLHTTAHHRFWDVTDHAWTGAGALTTGSSALLTPSGQQANVIAVVNTTGEEWMYDLTVADIHTYYVLAGSTPVLVHNTNTPIGCGLNGEPIFEIPPGSSGGPGAGQRIPASALADYNIGVNADLGLPTPLCSYCRTNPATSVDHVHPRVLGGDLTDLNLTPACTFCNSSKGPRGAPVNPPPNYIGPWPPPWWPASSMR